MPFYDYKCEKCGQKFEALHSMGAKPDSLQCEFCSSTDVQRIFHSVGLMRSSGDSPIAPMPSSPGCSSCASHSCGSCH